jgi:hypothetical protein
MKKLTLKLTIGLSALLIGITMVWASGILKVWFPQTANPPSAVTDTSATQQFARAKSGKILVSFKKFHYGKGWFAYFEIINDTPESVFYVGSKRQNANYADYCTLSVRPKEEANNFFPFKVLNQCHYSKVDRLQALESGKSIIFDVYEQDIRNLLNLKDANVETRAQFGFEFFVGAEKDREILWSEEITFPYDEYR